MGTLKTIIGFIFGSALYVVVLGIITLSLPFNVIALMHLWGYEWWSALLIAVFINAVPAVGQLAYIVFAVMGAFFFYQADFNWREATIKTFDSGVTSSFPKQFIADRTNFTQSIADFGEASDLTQPPSNNSGEGFKKSNGTANILQN